VTEEEEEAARRLFAGPIAFVLGAPRLDILPPPDLPEVAFAGRSNVGKSSLLNALAGRGGLARTSNTPGRTQELNVFAVGEPPRFRLVDMPGYGFAEAPEAVVRRWTRLVGDYLRGRPNLKRVLLLVDSRHGLKPVDRDVMKLLDKAAVSYQIVLTKADKVKEAGAAAVTEEARQHPAAHPDILVTSSAKGWGIPDLRRAVMRAALV
jgi:GTP-binding protein